MTAPINTQFREASTARPVNVGPHQRNIQAANVDWVEIAVTGTAQRIDDLLHAAGLTTRLAETKVEEAMRKVCAIAFVNPAADLRLRTKSTDTVYRTIPADEVTYIPVALLWSKYIDSGTAGSYQVEVLHESTVTY